MRLLYISLLVGICLAAAPQQPQGQAQLNPAEPRMLAKLSQQIKSKQDPAAIPELAASAEGDDCAEPPPRRCRHWHDSHNPNSPGWVNARSVGIGQLPDDLKAKLPQWVPARTVPHLPEEAAASGAAGGPCCVCPQCGLSFYTPNDYWFHIPQCIVPTGPPPCVQTSACLGNSHFDPDPRVCMCRPGPGSSSAAPVAASSSAAPVGSSSSSSS